MDESKDPAPSVSTELRPTLSPCAGGNHDDREDSNHGDQRPELGSLQIVVVVKEEEEDWDCYDTAGSPNQPPDCSASMSTEHGRSSSADRTKHSESGKKPRGKRKPEKTHSCLECGKKFVSTYTLRRHHAHTHTGEEKRRSHPSDTKGQSPSGQLRQQERNRGVRKTHSCPECGRHWQSISALKKHLRTHTGEKPYLCTECGKGFANPDSLRYHQNVNSKLKTEPTEITCCCGQEFSSKCVLEVHLKTDTGTKPYTCCVCGKRFRKESLKEHQRLHTGKIPYTCKFCGKGYYEKQPWKAHVRTHAEKPLCSVCGRISCNKYTFKIHERTHTGEKPYLCSECGKGFTSKGLLMTHERLYCTRGEQKRRAKPFHKCPDCGKDFTQANKLERHLRTHTGERPYQCSVCGMRFNQKGNLKTHFKVHTGGDPSLLADMEATLSPSNAADRPLDNRRKAGRPPRCLDQRGEKEAHDLPASQTDETQNLPTTQKPPISLRVDKHLLCPECGKTYPREYDLKIHLRTHTGERPYQCDECGKTFVRKQGLRQHRRSHAPKPMGPTRQLGRPPSMGSAGKRTNPSAHRIGRTKQKNH
ncbi:gastrula zinc finger protein XlCGF57.1-like isoform X2 [Esox lucius]|uniref:gastrula zinc finger protein XlCGF57.1-like isoform X2 n=1 Tax=Esox lucius TaxID=8010 RepID=UPI000661BAF9|nr:gastrula zinc finger protein XlCGF57.1-like isoform X2 [Esox lucius]